MDKLRYALTLLSFVIGTIFIATGILGVFRFRFALNRLHAASLIDTMGVMFIILGVILSTPCSVSWIKLLLMGAFVGVGSPVASHLLSLLEVATDDELSLHLDYVDKTGEAK